MVAYWGSYMKGCGIYLNTDTTFLCVCVHVLLMFVSVCVCAQYFDCISMLYYFIAVFFNVMI